MSTILFVGYDCVRYCERARQIQEKIICLGELNSIKLELNHPKKGTYSNIDDTIIDQTILSIVILRHYNFENDKYFHQVEEKIRQYRKLNIYPSIYFIDISSYKPGYTKLFADINCRRIFVVETIDKNIFEDIIRNSMRTYNILLTESKNMVSNVSNNIVPIVSNDMALVDLLVSTVPLKCAADFQFEFLKEKIALINELFNDITYKDLCIRVNVDYYHIREDVEIVSAYYNKHGFTTCYTDLSDILLIFFKTDDSPTNLPISTPLVDSLAIALPLKQAIDLQFEHLEKKLALINELFSDISYKNPYVKFNADHYHIANEIKIVSAYYEKQGYSASYCDVTGTMIIKIDEDTK